MKPLYGNAVVGQSGGPTAAINATLAGVIEGTLSPEGKQAIGTLYGMRNGVEGLLEGRLVNLSERFADPREIELLKNTPAAALGSCRKKLPPVGEGEETYARLFEIFRRYDIRYFFYIGGNDSMDAVAKLSAYFAAQEYEIRIVGLPKTIDNDLVGTDHTPGFGSAAKYIATSMQEMVRDCAVYTVRAVTIVEIMGRDAGWLTASAALPTLMGAGPDYVYLPERAFDMQAFFTDLRAAFARHPNVVVAVSEGIRDKDGRYIGEGTQSGATDAFGHRYLAGTAKALEMAVKAEFGCKVRSVELNLPQRCASHIASATDLSESAAAGRHGVARAIAGESGCMVTILRVEGEAYAATFGTSPVSEIANAVRLVPDEFINEAANGVTPACLAYLLPLIAGEAQPVWQDGLPVHCVI